MLCISFGFCHRCSEGCAGAIKRILSKVEGVTDIETNVSTKLVVVKHNDLVAPQDMNEKLQKV
jgi:copper chaperone CopZ